MSSRNKPAAGIGEATAAVGSDTGHQKTSWVWQMFSRAKDVVPVALSVASTSVAPIVEESDAFSNLEDRVSNFAENSKTIMVMWDELAKAYPFISAVVSICKGALILELARQDNNEKVRALMVKMCDMMSVFNLLRDLAFDDEGKQTVERRLRQRLVAIIGSVKRCAKVCESYRKKHTAVKFFTSLKWKEKFTDVAAQFDVHKSELQFDLQMYVGTTVANVKATLAVVHQDVSEMMTLVFENMRSPEEQDFAALVASSGGAKKVFANDALLSEVLDKFKLRSDKQDSDDAELSPSSLREEVAKNPDEVVMEDAKAFDQRFDAVVVQLEEEAKLQPKPPTLSTIDERLAEVEAKLAAAVEDRLARVEAKLDERAIEHAGFVGDIAVLNARVGKLEALLTQLVGARMATS